MADYTRFPEAFKAAGISFTEEPGWRDRGRGDIVSFNFMVIHHTAGGNDAGDIRVVRDGRSDLPGPLSQLVLKRNGEPHIIAAGVSLHAGYGPAMWGSPEGNGNFYSIGIEGVSNGYNDWTDEQRKAYPRVVAAILKDAGLPPDRWIFHRDYNKRDGKIDPAGFDADWFDKEVRKHYNASNKSDIQITRDKYPQLGNKVIKEDELPTKDGVGRYANYDFGTIVWHPSFGAHAIMGAIYKKYVELGAQAGFLGYPIKDELKIRNGGYVMDFQGGNLYYVPSKGTFFVTGEIKNAWGATNWENGPYGYPVSDQKGPLPDGLGYLQDFESGHAYWSPKTGTHFVKGKIWDEYCNQQWERGIGYPTTDELPTQGDSGRYNHFEKASIYYKFGTNHAWTVRPPIRSVWKDLGWERGKLGFPLNNEYVVENGVRQDFEGGSIQVDGDKTIIIVNGEYIELPKKEPEQPKPEVSNGKYTPTAEEKDLIHPADYVGKISHFANLDDASTRGRNMGITGEPADKPWDQWFCAMRFRYVGTMPNPNNPAWLKPVDRTDISEAEKFRLKAYLPDRRLKITNHKTGKSVVVRPADYGPGVPTRVIDVSQTAIKALGAATDDEVSIEWVDPSTKLGPVA